MKLLDDNTLTGLITSLQKPLHDTLIVAVHGGTYSSSYFEANPSGSLLSLCASAGIPAIAIDRPSYKGSTSLSPTATESHIQQQGKYIHNVIIPSIWSAFRQSLGINKIVLYGHGLGCAICIVAAACYSQALKSTSTMYNLSGLALVGIADKLIIPMANDLPPASVSDAVTGFPVEVKDTLMLNMPKGLHSAPSIYEQTLKLDHIAPAAEIYDIVWQWPSYGHRYAREVAVPVWHARGENDAMWGGSQDLIHEYAALFEEVYSVPGAMYNELVPAAPHCIELSYGGPEITLKIMGWAIGIGRACLLQKSE
jgi:pimeloyl-ACP methyl ester carboxylesterase